jgi:hypothetical protein
MEEVEMERSPKDAVMTVARSLGILMLLIGIQGVAQAHPPDETHGHHAGDQPGSGGKHGSLAETGAKLSNPVSDVWALFTEFDLSFNNGNANQGDDKVGSLMNFQPIMPIPIFGKGKDRWQLLIRPAVPIQFAAPRPDDLPPAGNGNSTNYDAGLADILFPMLLTPSQNITGSNLIFGVGPTLVLPTSTKVQLGRRQWQIGPAAGVGWKTKDYVVGVFPQYFFGVGGRGDQGSNIKDASNMNLLYFAFLNLPNAWQIGMNPVIAYDDKASSGNKWNVPVGIVVAKTIKVGKMPVKFQLGVEYSVVSQDDFGKRATIKLNIIPVIGSLVKGPIFGGG